MPQHEHMERHAKLHGKRFDAEERARKREARLAHKRSEFAQKVHGLRAKLYNERRFKEKAAMRKTIAQHNQRNNKHANDEAVADGAVPAYLLDREGVSRAKVLSNTVKQKRKEKAGKWEVPIPKVKPVADDEMFKVMRTGKKNNKAWKRVVTKCTVSSRVLSSNIRLRSCFFNSYYFIDFISSLPFDSSLVIVSQEKHPNSNVLLDLQGFG